MDSDAWQIIHIPGKPPVSPDNQPTVGVYASVIEPKSANTLVRHLCRVSPLEDLRHVKRIRKEILPDRGETKLTVILCLAPEHDEGQSNNMPPDVQDLVNSYQLSPFLAKVCKYAALSKKEWEEQCKLWPTSYHPPTYNVDGIGGFSDEDSQSVCKFMRLVINLAISGDKPLVNAAVMVDPSSRQVIASETDQVHLSFAPHDITSRETSDRTETFFLDGTLGEKKGSCSAVACLNPWCWSLERNIAQECDQWHPLRHAAIVAIESSSTRDRNLFPNPVDDHVPNHYELFSIDSPSKKQKTSIQSPDGTRSKNGNRENALEDTIMERPYLCTGYDIFLLWEPCTMCAMALVHQRIKRVFYAFPNPKAGGLGSVHRLQGEKSLNHHYAVFRVLVPAEVLGPHHHIASSPEGVSRVLLGSLI
ncbi:PREDICTED: probable inactive tRNA-specific adenosine deaminase-like protein 3 isoform X2 [Tarenaya hassleriana]|uniref:probable inactive tRNA-specific adenosine deaminase-like protein 3 isoform X2 n=1 Tax=Tarenaya hassleriana TaxID=28532 RepID=UPI00053C0A2E|nr:PREDICTED: probable inactive tRNA-specific adenosine deaminase-like protein 3 isoform X2 [Tarenaya hassleriana]